MHTPRTPLLALLLAAAALPGLASAQTSAGSSTASETLAAATADRTAAGCPPLAFTNLQRRVLIEADRGIDALRRYVHRTRMMHMLDLHDTSVWVEQVRSRNADCRVIITAAAP